MAVRNMLSVCPLLIADEIVQVSDYFNSQLDCPDDRLRPFIDYLKDRQGKMLRASCVLLTGRLFAPVAQLHIKIAGTVEMIHAATLLHDDVIDNAAHRRHQATANNLWGSNFAVLLGDFLLSRAFVAVASLQRDDINRLLAETAVRICRGEMLQNACRGDFSVSIEEYLDIIEKKTAVFFADCCRLGAMASGADAKSCGRLYEFGLNFGMSFQITDDLTDILDTESRTGKTAGRDRLTGTLTLPVIHAFGVLDSKAKSELLDAFDNEQIDSNRIISILHTSKSIDFAKSCAQQYCRKALAALDSFGSHPAVSALKEMALSATQIPL
ncbi:MAG: polyprenyl synthetase family protein [Phycisphaerae bacterium]|nr:polyprenyl synthetase family protein [Phycisphaerae bacterium]